MKKLFAIFLLVFTVIGILVFTIFGTISGTKVKAYRLVSGNTFSDTPCTLIINDGFATPDGDNIGYPVHRYNYSDCDYKYYVTIGASSYFFNLDEK